MPAPSPLRRFALPVCLLAVAGVAAVGQALRVQVGVQPDGSVVVPTNQTLTPIGAVRRLEGARPKDMALSPDGSTLAVLATSRVAFFDAAGQPAGEVSLTGGALGIAWTPDGRAIYASTNTGRIFRLAQDGGQWKVAGEFPLDFLPPMMAAGPRQRGNPQPNGLAVSPDGKTLYAALGIRNEVAAIRLPEMNAARTVAVGVAPYSVLLSPDGKTLFVGNRGGERPREEEVAVAPSAGTPVRVDPWTDAALGGSVSVIDTASFEAQQIEIGRHPAGMALSPNGQTLYVANSDSDTVSLVDLPSRRQRSVLSVRPADDPGFGQIPTDLALSKDGSRLYVTCSGANAVAVVRLGRQNRVRGYLPTGWYPIAVEEREGRLMVASAKGIGARMERRAGAYNVHGSVGTLQFIPPLAEGDLERHTRQVAANNLWGKEMPPRKDVAAVPMPERVGEPSVFKHVVYIIRENHTYDLDFGDMPEGKGDKSLCLFPEEVTPNSHALARQWVLLDNTYTSGTNSADGHQWTDSAVANSYVEQNYNAHSRSYPYDGGDPLAYSPEGFLWNMVRKQGKEVRVYGEFVNRPKVVDPATGKTPTWTELWRDYKSGANRMQITAETDNASLRPVLHPNYIGFPSIVSDQWRADQYLADLREWEKVGKMPALSMLLLPNDHTAGTRPGMPTPRAATADGDLATGRIIEALSKSRFWKEMLVLVIMDDSQLGLDHVDGHRTVAMCVSPYTKRKVVVSQPYNHTSFLRAIELVLGLPAMTRFDRTANPLRELFTDKPDFTPFTHIPNRIPLDEMNPPARALKGEARRLAEACDRLNWTDVDRADAEVVSKAVWRSVRPNQPFPRHHFHPVEEADEEEAE